MPGGDSELGAQFRLQFLSLSQRVFLEDGGRQTPVVMAMKVMMLMAADELFPMFRALFIDAKCFVVLSISWGPHNVLGHFTNRETDLK